MKTDIILAGVGGQGILSIAATIGLATVHSNLHIKQAEVHGMSQRGGAVQSNLRISDQKIASDLIPLGAADLILSVEPMESLRYLPFLSEKGWIVTNITPFKNIQDYPEMDAILNEIKKYPNHVLIDADEIAQQIGSKRYSNMIMLGAASSFINLSLESLKEGVHQLFVRKGEDVVNANVKALIAGREFANHQLE